jgi:hypothetical protein
MASLTLHVDSVARRTMMRGRVDGSIAQAGEMRVRIGRTTAGSLARVRVGRLIEVRVGRLATLSDVESLNDAVRAAAGGAGRGAVICADYRRTKPFTGEVAGAWSQAMRRANESIVRSAVLLNPSNTMFNLQVERVVHCAANEQRRLFRDAKELQDWLEGILTAAEREALRVFLSSGSGEEHAKSC